MMIGDQPPSTDGGQKSPASFKPRSTFRSRIAQMRRCALESHYDTAPNLVHAFANCLTDAEVGRALITTLADKAYLRSVILTQVHRRAKAGSFLSEFDSLIAALVDAGEKTPKLRVRADAVISRLYPELSPPTRERVLEMWLRRGTSGATSRWLNAISSDDMLFSLSAITAFWQSTGDSRAAKLIAERADPDDLSGLILVMIQDGEPGSTISAAMLRAASVPDEAWAALRAGYPATFAYASAMLGRPIEADDAYDIIMACEPGIFGDRGLAIWSVGRLGMWSVLERVHASVRRGRAPTRDPGTRPSIRRPAPV